MKLIPLRLTLLALLVLSFACDRLYANAGGVPPGYTKTLWQSRDGLPEETVQAFAQSSDGYLWIGTSGGLLRFDGARFTLFNRDNTPEFKENSVWCLLTGDDGALWIGTEGGGLLRYSHGRFRRYFTSDGLTDGFVRAIFRNPNGTMWIGTDDGLFRFEGERIIRVDKSKHFPPIAVHAIWADHRGRLWVGGSRLLMLRDGVVKEYKLRGDSSANRVKSILETRDGTVWVGTVAGLNRMKGSDSFQPVEGIRGTVRVLHEGSDGLFWVGTIGSGIFLYRQGRFSQIKAPDGVPSSTILNIFEDSEKNVWIGTQVGMVRFSRTPMSIVFLPGAADSDFGTVYRDHDGSLWFGSTHLFRLQNGVPEQRTFPGMTGVKVRNVLRDASGALWLGTDGAGVYRLVGNALTHYTKKTGLTNDFTRVMIQARDGSIWIGADEGVTRWGPHGLRKFQVSDGLCYFSVRDLLEDHSGNIWIATERGVSCLRNEKFQRNLATGTLRGEKVWAIHEDAEGGLWFGTRNGGLYLFKEGRITHFTTAQGLASNSIYKILEDTAGYFWLSGPNGISVFKRKELEAAAVDSTAEVSLAFYGISEDLETTQIYGGTQSSGCLGTKGDGWFPTNHGPLHILARSASPLDSFRLVFGRVLVDGHEVPNEGSISIAPGNSALEISYAPVLLRSQQDIRFRYKLDRFDHDWSTPVTRRTAYYTSLPPGKYTFRVEAFEMNNPQALAVISLPVVQQAYFYRTSWFLSLCALMFGFCIWLVDRMRVRQVRARFQAVLDERSRLAREVHDTIIQGCSSTSALLEASSSMEQCDKVLSQQLVDYARKQIRETVDEARQAVWNLRNGETAASDVRSSLKRIAENAGKESGIPIQYEELGQPFPLDQPTSHEVLMVVREAVHNAVVHAQASRIRISLHFSKTGLVVEVRDDGCGFDPAGVKGPEDQHYGLSVMQERTGRIGARLQVNSAIGEGTQLRIEIPQRPMHRDVPLEV